MLYNQLEIPLKNCASCRDRACPARSLPQYPFYGSIRRGGIHPSRAPPTAANGHGGQRAGRPTCDTGKAAPLRGVEDAAHTMIFEDSATGLAAARATGASVFACNQF